MAGENVLAQLKAVVDPLTIFGRYVSLKKSGNRYKALCPFHTEKTPSFYAASNGMFHCFGCGMGGDVITFVMNIEKLDFKECLQLLSTRYGIPLKMSGTADRKERDLLLDLMRQAAEFFHSLLTTHAAGKEALDYLEQRSISKDTIRRFQLGWAPASWNSLLEHFHKRDVDPTLLEKCGLIVPRQQEGYYDRYRSRIIVPIHDIHGNIIAFGGRIFQGSGEEAKYLNSPETPIYSKSNQLFGLYFSKDAIQEKKIAILVEGYFDMILPFQAGHNNIVASLGTSLTENQAKLLRRYTDHVVLFYDPDTAGQAAVLRALPILLRENFAVNVAMLPQGLDPDQYIRERGAEEFQNEIHRALRYDQLLLQNLGSKYDLKSPPGKLAASEELMGYLDVMTNPFEKIGMIKQFAMAVGISPDMMQEHYRKKRRIAAPQKQTTSRPTLAEVERRLLQVLLIDPNIAKEVLPEFEEADFEELSRADIFRQLHQIVQVGEDLSSAEVIHEFVPEVQRFLTALIMDETAPVPSAEQARDWLYQRIRPARKTREAGHIHQEIEAGQTGDPEKLNRLLEEKLRLVRESKAKKS